MSGFKIGPLRSGSEDLVLFPTTALLSLAFTPYKTHRVPIRFPEVRLGSRGGREGKKAQALECGNPGSSLTTPLAQLVNFPKSRL